MALGAGLMLALGCAGASPPPAAPPVTAGAGSAAVVEAPLPAESPEPVLAERAPQEEPLAGPSAAGETLTAGSVAAEAPAAEAGPGETGAAESGAAEAAAGESGAGETAAGEPIAAVAPPARRTPPGEPLRRELIVIDEGSSPVRPEPGELARTTRRDAAAAPGGSPRITNENLGEYARRGRVSVSGTATAPPAEAAADGDGSGEPAAADAAADDATSGEPLRDEAWWRARAREIREEWRRTADDLAAFEEAAADLRWRFYAEDDPWVRDGQVKPEWDRVLDRLSEARRRLDDYPRRIEALIEEGRRAGALPGWLREGIELEPSPEELPGAEPDPAEPVEPRQVDEGQRGPRR